MRAPPVALTLAVLLPLIACGPAAPYVQLPTDAVIGAGDPTRAAIIGSAYAFGAPSSIAARPAAAARAAAQVEFLAAETPSGPRYFEYSPSIGQELTAARDELRMALGIAPGASPQAVVDGLYAVSRALGAQDGPAATTALMAPVFQDGQVTLTRLGSLPPLPRTRIATALTNSEMNRVDQDGRFSGSGGGDGGKN